MFANLKLKLKESAASVLPITVIILALCIFVFHLPIATVVKFIISSLFLFFGIGLFSLGAEMSMMPIGQNIASTLTRLKKIWLLIISCLVIGVIITIAEPDLAVLASQIPSINKWTFILTVGAGVGICFMLGVLRIFFKIPFAALLTIGYAIIFTLLIFVPKTFWAIAFDASGVTTGALSVPFIMSFCLGISAIRSGNSSEEDSFGLVAICSMGPIFSVLILGILSGNLEITASETVVAQTTFASMPGEFGASLLAAIKDVALVLLPILAIFFVFQFSAIHLPAKQVYKILIGVVYTYIGVVLFMSGGAVFTTLGTYIGSNLMLENTSFLVYPISFILGYTVVAAEPAVHVLVEQVASVSGNSINKKVLSRSLSIGVGVSLVIAAIRAIFAINILFFVLPIFAISLGLAFYNSKLFTAVAFDSGGIASGPMSAAFLLSYISGIAAATSGDVYSGAFGAIALIATTPILVIQILGAIAQHKVNVLKKKQAQKSANLVSVVEFEF